MKVKVQTVSKNSFRRAGMKFTSEPIIIDVDKKTLAILKAEKNLTVEELKRGKT